MPEETAEDLEEAVQNAQKVTTPDVCKTPTPSAGEVPIPYPNISKSSDATSGNKTVKTEGKETMKKGASYTKSSGDESGQSNLGRITNVVKTKKLFNVPIVVWGVAAIILIILVWILTLNRIQPAEHLEHIIRIVYR